MESVTFRTSEVPQLSHVRVPANRNQLKNNKIKKLLNQF